MRVNLAFFGFIALAFLICFAAAEEAETSEDEVDTPKVTDDIGKSRDGSKTDDEVVKREEEAINIDGLSVAEVKQLRESAEKHAFQAEVSRMMKLIINSLYKNKEIFLRELISNASDALDKIRFLSLTDKSVLSATDEFSVKIKADKDNNILHITDTGIGMTKDDLIKQLGTIAKSGTSEFFQKMQEAGTANQASDLIGQFGVGFYSAFLVADRVIVTSKNNDDKQHIWESDSAEFSISEDPRGPTLKRGTQISLYLKEEARDFLEPNTLKDLIKKYSQFINFNIYLWSSKTEQVEEPVEETAEEKKAEDKADETKADDDEDGKVEEAKEEDKKPKTKKVEKTIWDWELMNGAKPIWLRAPKDVSDDDYNEFYKAISKESDNPMAKTHFVAEGEVTFKSVLFIPKSPPSDIFSDYGKRRENIKLYVRRVFITDDFQDMMPKYLSFIRGIVDSDDLPLNVSREQLQQHKLLKVIRKKLVRKTLDMIKKISDEDYKEKFWKEYSTNIKLGVIEDHSNRTRLAKLLRFRSSNDPEKMTSLADYLGRMKDKQDVIFFMAGASLEEVKNSPFVERLLRKGYEVLYLIEPVDEYCIQSLPEFEGKKFQNVAKEGLKFGDEDEAKQKAKLESLEKEYEPLMKWMKETGLKDLIEKATISQRLTESPLALVASSYGWSANMERIMSSQAYAKAKDPSQSFYTSQKKTLEVNPYHPLIKELNAKVKADPNDSTAKDLALVMFETAAIRSGYNVKDSLDFAKRIERMLRLSMGVDLDAKVELPDDNVEEEEVAEEAKSENEDIDIPENAKKSEPVPAKEDEAEDEHKTSEHDKDEL
ncbi:endoplasmin [Hydra vulgaris]|nr:endoplasmin [Hydra vulgaris]